MKFNNAKVYVINSRVWVSSLASRILRRTAEELKEEMRMCTGPANGQCPGRRVLEPRLQESCLNL